MFTITFTTGNPAIAEQVKRWDEEGSIELARFENPQRDVNEIIDSMSVMDRRYVRALCNEGLPIHAIKWVREHFETSLLPAKLAVDYLRAHEFCLPAPY